MRFRLSPGARALLAATALVGAALGGLLVGWQPVTGDPDCMYRPIKSELVRSLRRGLLPYWSDCFATGVPLVAESHVAAFYPPNWVLYRAFDVEAAYRVSMWLHYAALAAATYAYARTLGLTTRGAALAAVSFSLCGFQMSHACHEPFYHVLPYLVLALLFTERYLASGNLACLAALALTLGVQITLGHFQIQSWTLGLVLIIGAWRVAFRAAPRARLAGLALACGWGLAVAYPQLSLTAEMQRVSEFKRTNAMLSNYSFPPAHWAQLAAPQLFSDFAGNTTSPYWGTQETTPDEATLYVGSLPLVLAFLGAFASRDRALAPWRLIVPLAFILATMPRWWPAGYALVLHVPGLNLFRAPGRYVLLTSLGLCLLAGRGLDPALSPRRGRMGLATAVVFIVAALAWAGAWSGRADILAALRPGVRGVHLATAAASLGLALGAVVLWRRRPGPSVEWAVILTTAAELAFLYYHGTVPWGRAAPFPEQSPVFQALAREQRVGLVVGPLQNLPVKAGFTTAYPTVGIVAPPPTYLLEPTLDPGNLTTGLLNWAVRVGVTHGVYDGAKSTCPATIVYLGPDPILDALLPSSPSRPTPRTYRLERYPGAFPDARVAKRVELTVDWYDLFGQIVASTDPDVVWYERNRAPASRGPRATTARLIDWDGLAGTVEHDGAVDLVVRRTWYPGWTVQLDDGVETPVLNADNRLQAARIEGRGVTRVRFRYRPRGLLLASLLSAAAVAGAFFVIGREAFMRRRAGQT